MIALVKLSHKKDDFELMEVPEPIPEADQIKVKVKKTGICGTDIYGYQAVKAPVILGHETSGVVVAKGKNVKGIQIGERVTTETTVSICGKCRFCQTKDYNLCSNRKGLGSAANGAFAEYFSIRKESIHKLPSNVDFAAGSLCEPLACAVHAVAEQAKVSSGEIVLIFGPGPFGLLVAQVVNSLGAKVIICGKEGDEKRLRLAKLLGAEVVVNLKKGG
ncbi:MAG: alcohol dehydrogenase catalytic domain-containing protein, partial [Candidatus Omnitrophica bacterium]|nr:alcohol dehydrogenase catalytic domain-containing protein [Candidatus Omnitrophota bacterium]